MKRIEVVAAIIEHEDSRWLAPDELDSVKWLPADEGIIELLARRFNRYSRLNEIIKST